MEHTPQYSSRSETTSFPGPGTVSSHIKEGGQLPCQDQGLGLLSHSCTHTLPNSLVHPENNPPTEPPPP